MNNRYHILYPFKFVGLLPMLFVFLFFQLAEGQNSKSSDDSITAKVVDGDGEPLIGVYVYAVDSSFLDVTDIDGLVRLKNMSYATLVNFSYIGYKDVTLAFFQIQQSGGVVTLETANDLLPTIVVIGRRDDRPEDIPYQVASIGKEQIAFLNSQTTADALQHNENVFIQKSQMGGGSVNIRGFEANKVLLVVDGVRLNNIIYRNGHLQDAIKVDNGMLERIEVIYGPGALTYGSDALGGVVHFRTKDPILYNGENTLNDQAFTSNAYARFATANYEKTAHVDFNYSAREWASLTSLSFSSFDDLKVGSRRLDDYPDFGKREQFVFVQDDQPDEIRSTKDFDVLTYTGYSQIDFLQKFKFQPTEHQYHTINLQYSTSTDVPRFDRLSEYSRDKLKFAEWYYGPQQRFLSSVKSQFFEGNLVFDKATLIGSYQRIFEDRYDRRFGSIDRFYDWEDVDVYGFTADFDRSFPNNIGTLTYGFDFNYNNLRSEAGRIIKSTGQRFLGVTSRYPNGGSQMNTLAAYVNYKWSDQDGIWTAFAGGRYSRVNLQTRFKKTPSDEFRWPDYFYEEGLSTTNASPTWSTGLIFNKSNWQIKAIASTAFRAPNIDDFAKFREKGGFIRIPNLDLKPEYTLNGELAIAKTLGDMRSNGLLIGGNLYYSKLTDAITETDYHMPTGINDTLFISGDDEFRVQANINAEQAYIQGASFNLTTVFRNYWHFKSSMAYTYGRIVHEQEEGEDWEEPLSHIPPLFGKTSLSYERETWKVGFVIRYNGKKVLEDYASGSEDNLQYATPEGTPAWTTYNLYSTIPVFDRWSLDFAVENILDLHYRPFASGVSAAGRNFIFALRGKF